MGFRLEARLANQCEVLNGGSPQARTKRPFLGIKLIAAFLILAFSALESENLFAQNQDLNSYKAAQSAELLLSELNHLDGSNKQDLIRILKEMKKTPYKEVGLQVLQSLREVLEDYVRVLGNQRGNSGGALYLNKVFFEILFSGLEVVELSLSKGHLADFIIFYNRLLRTLERPRARTSEKLENKALDLKLRADQIKKKLQLRDRPTKSYKFVLMGYSQSSGENVGHAGRGQGSSQRNLEVARRFFSPEEFLSKNLAGSDAVLKQKLGALLGHISTSFPMADIHEALKAKKWLDVEFREDEVKRVFNKLNGLQRNPVLLIGESGSGTSSVVREVALRVYQKNFVTPVSEPLHRENIWITLDALLLRDHFNAIEINDRLFESLAKVQQYLHNQRGRGIVLIIENAGSLPEENLNSVYLAVSSGIKAIFVSDHQGFLTRLSNHPKLKRKLEKGRVDVSNLTASQSAQILQKNWVERYSERYNVSISNENLNLMMELVEKYHKNMAMPQSAIDQIEALFTRVNRRERGQPYEIQKSDLFELLRAEGLPELPENRESYLKSMKDLESRLNQRLIGQEHLVDHVVNQLKSAVSDPDRTHRSILITGITGTGKSYIGQLLAEEYFGDPEKLLTIDMTKYKGRNGGNSASFGLFGATAGYISSDSNKGVIPTYLSGAGKDGGVILINEMEKASPAALEVLMELLENGEKRGGDGNLYRLGNHLVIFTSNLGVSKIFPPELIRDMTREELNRYISQINSRKLSDVLQEGTGGSQGESYSMKPEVLGRLDGITASAPLLKEDAEKVGWIEVREYQRLIEQRESTHIKVSEDFVEVFLGNSYDPYYGVRGIARKIRKLIEKSVDTFLARGHGSKSDVIEIDAWRPQEDRSLMKIQVSAPNGGSVELDGPREPVADLLQDATMRERLLTLESALNKKIYGQERNIERAVTTIQGHLANPGSGKAASLFLIGPTGTGKTQMGKEIAQHLFHSSPLIIDMSIPENSRTAFHQLESWLEKNRFSDGGVVIFDEMSNLGAGSSELKQALAKQFYALLDESKKWSSPSGEVWDVSRTIFMFTGNDGEHLVSGISDEHLRRKQREKASVGLRGLLREAGFSAAFVGRLSEVLFIGAPGIDDREKIAKKMQNEWREEILSEGRKFKVRFQSGFSRDVARLMYDPDVGGRSIEKIYLSLSSVIPDMVRDFPKLMKAGAEKYTLRFRLDWTGPKAPFYVKTPPEKRAEVVAELKNHLGEIIQEKRVDFTEQARFMPQVAKPAAWKVAVHEAGHAVVNVPEWSGRKVDFISIVPGERQELKFLGFASYEAAQTRFHNLNRTALIHRIAIKLAGSEAEKYFSDQVSEKDLGRNTGIGQDVTEVRKLLSKALLSSGMVPELDGITLNSEGRASVNNLTEKQREILEREKNKIIEEARSKIQEIFTEKWDLLMWVATELIEKHTISGERFEELYAAWRTKNQATLEQVKRNAYENYLADLRAFEGRKQGALLGSEIRKLGAGLKGGCRGAFVNAL